MEKISGKTEIISKFANKRFCQERRTRFSVETEDLCLISVGIWSNDSISPKSPMKECRQQNERGTVTDQKHFEKLVFTFPFQFWYIREVEREKSKSFLILD